LGPNLKVCNLAGLEAEARHPILVLCDSDMRAEPDFLRRVTAPLRQPEVGLVTCLYKGVAPKTLADRIEALGIGTDFIPSVLVSALLRPVDFALGSAIALHRDTLRQIGGFRGLAHHLADDYQMGQRVWGMGKRVALADLVLEDVLPGEGLKAMLARRVRWARTVRLSAPAGYRGAFMTHGTTLALLGLVASGGTSLGWGVFGGAWACRVATSLYVSLFALGERGVLARLWLLPVADLLSAGIWAAGLWGKRVAWRGSRYKVSPEGILTPLDE
ncbi:MAG TPA: glycosyltransferase, partial [Armatimonadota bacterium]